MKKILLLESENYPLSAISKLEQFFDVVIKEFNNQSQFDIYLKSNSFFAIFTKLGLYIGEQQISTQSELKYIVTATTGLNHIDLKYSSETNIKIISLKGEFGFLRNIKSTAEHTWMLILAISRNLYPAISDVKINSRWNRRLYLADELNEKTIGIIGYGRLGKIIAEYAQIFGMNILAYDNDDTTFSNTDVLYKTSLNYLLTNADYIVLLISWNEKNMKFFNSEMFNVLKKGAYFINTSRGELVDEKALLDSLKSNKLSGAAIDVLDGDSSWGSESHITNDLLKYSSTHHNLLITPHMGGYGRTSIYKTREFIINLFLKENE